MTNNRRAQLLTTVLNEVARTVPCAAVLKTELWDSHGKVHRCGRPETHVLKGTPHRCKRCGREWSS
jgi:hypothetical protein